GTGHPGRDHVVDQGHDGIVRAHPRGPGRARPQCARDALLARVRNGRKVSHHRPPAAQPSVRGDRPARRWRTNQPGRTARPGAEERLSWDGRGWDAPETIAAPTAGGEPAWEPG